jgi:pyrroloquinoline quinone biosynthesis protein E
MNQVSPPLALLAELTHRCPLQCPYCSNPINLERASQELTTAEWKRAIDEAAAMGVLQIHFSGGEPTVRPDLEDLIRHAHDGGLYTNLITAGVLLDEHRIGRLIEAGLDHVQLSFQDSEPGGGDRIGGFKGGHARKIEVARLIRAAGVPLTLNLVVHRQNLHHLEELIAMALDLDAHRIEIAHVQYYGWAFRNRAALMPTREQLEAATATVTAARERLKGRVVIDYVVPDYYARRPKSCMGGWGRQFLNISPAGKVLPCHAAESVTSLSFGAAAAAGGYLAELRSLQPLSWDPLDAGALPLLRSPRDRLGRLPLSGFRYPRRRRRDGSCLRSVAPPRSARAARPDRFGERGAAVRIPAHRGSLIFRDFASRSTHCVERRLASAIGAAKAGAARRSAGQMFRQVGRISRLSCRSRCACT